MPSVVGIDIGCGMTIAKIKGFRAEFQKLDAVIRENIPSGFQTRKIPHRFSDRVQLSELSCYKHIQEAKANHSLGTLGGGNHFIEVDKGEDGSIYVVIHSGSRHLGKEVAEYYLTAGQRILKSRGIQIPYELVYLDGAWMEDYIHDVAVVQAFAEQNRAAILDELVKDMKWKVLDSWSCAHNYIDTRDDLLIIRKGAISAKAGEKVIIPINMRDGVILGTGIGNHDWNNSAPHGTGRIMSRTAVKQHFTVSSFKKEMKGVYFTCVGSSTLDEAPFAYRSIDQIKHTITDTVTIDEIIKPVYNFKAGGTE